VIEKSVEYIGASCDQISIDALEKNYKKSTVKRKYDALVPGDDTVDIGFSYYARETFFHRRHVSCIETRPAALQLGQICRPVTSIDMMQKSIWRGCLHE
jgi:hypothetical protein